MHLRKILLILVLLTLTLSVLVYGTYKALPIILGPKIELTSPHPNEIAEGTTMEVSGHVYRAKQLTVNSIPTAFTETGEFYTKIAIYPGENILIVEATDRFGRVVTITRNIGTKN